MKVTRGRADRTTTTDQHHIPMKTTGIIGGAGFIGSHVTNKFLSEGHRVRVGTTDLTSTERLRT